MCTGTFVGCHKFPLRGLHLEGHIFIDIIVVRRKKTNAFLYFRRSPLH